MLGHLLPQYCNVGVRGYATLKDIQMRLKSIKNIGKITKSMKMIASTKLNRAQKTMEIGRNYSIACTDALRQILQAETAGAEKDKDGDAKKETAAGDEQRKLLIVCSSDRGLCGAIHSSLSKLTRKTIRETDAALGSVDGTKTIAVVLGDKAKPQVARDCRNAILLSVNQVGKNPPTLSEALAITNAILSAVGPDEAAKRQISVLFNRFKSVIAYENATRTLPTATRLTSAPGWPAYTVKDETIEPFLQWTLANAIFQGLVEGYASEMAARRMAMENATKNSETIVQSLTMQYNRTRQAVITNELVDIITGASAL